MPCGIILEGAGPDFGDELDAVLQPGAGVVHHQRHREPGIMIFARDADIAGLVRKTGEPAFKVTPVERR
jgi:hypothetical protein